MVRLHIFRNPGAVSDIAFIEFHDEASNDWMDKAAALQARRWRAMKRASKADFL
jgi:hypothetical protein